MRIRKSILKALIKETISDVLEGNENNDFVNSDALQKALGNKLDIEGGNSYEYDYYPFEIEKNGSGYVLKWLEQDGDDYDTKLSQSDIKNVKKIASIIKKQTAEFKKLSNREF